MVSEACLFIHFGCLFVVCVAMTCRITVLSQITFHPSTLHSSLLHFAIVRRVHSCQWLDL